MTVVPFPSHMRERLAADVCSTHSHVLRCSFCDRSEEITMEQFAEYLRIGWPKCCGGTMGLESVPRKQM